MTDTQHFATWLPVIGRALARMALSRAVEQERDKFKDVLTRVDFLEALGLPTRDAAEAAGSTAASVAELRRRNRGNGKKANKKTRGRRR
jgi:hypothetical protein